MSLGAVGIVREVRGTKPAPAPTLSLLLSLDMFIGKSRGRLLALDSNLERNNKALFQALKERLYGQPWRLRPSFMAGDLGTPDIGGEAKSSSLYVVSQLAIGNQRREPASKKVRHGITTISDLCFHVFFFWTGLVLQLCVAIGFFKTQTSPFATAMHFWLVGHEDLFSLQPTLVTLARRRRISCDKAGFYLRFFFAPRYGGALKNQPFLVPIRISPQISVQQKFSFLWTSGQH